MIYSAGLNSLPFVHQNTFSIRAAAVQSC